MYVKSIIFLTLFWTLSAGANPSFEAAKRAAESLKTNPVVPPAPAKSAPKEVYVKPEGMDVLICPETGPKFIRTVNTTFRSMDDLVSALREERRQYEDFFYTLLQLDKRKPDDEIAAGQMVDLKKGVDQKLKRARENYNGQIKELAGSLPKAKKCWSYHDQKIKPDIGRLMEIFTKEPVLTEYKDCVKVLTENNKLFAQRFNLALNYYNKATSQGTTVSEAKKNGELIKASETRENRVCKNFAPNGIYADYLINKYEKQTVESKKAQADEQEKSKNLANPLPLNIPPSVFGK